ncbi:MAG: hypothetical protein IPG78_09260 [Ignavibacteria bacterium]|nr:hypothetical protein [Ignavibacteria bacterium]
MHNNSLIKLLRSFSPKEISDFKEFLNSPYFNKKKSVIELFVYIQKYYPDFTDDALSKRICMKIYFRGKFIMTVISEFLFIIFMNWQKVHCIQ